MKRILVIGCPGAGKSTFSRELSKITGLPLFHLDMLWHRSDRTNVSQEEFDERLQDILVQERWIIDGNFQRTMERRLQYCDTVFLLDYPVSLCLESVEGRIGKERLDMPWVEECFDPEFRQAIVDFPQTKLPQIYALLERYSGQRTVYIMKTREQAEKILEEIGSDLCAKKPI